MNLCDIWILQNNSELVRGGDLGDGKVKDGTELAICCYFLKLDDSYMDSYCTPIFVYAGNFYNKKFNLKKLAYILYSEVRTVRTVVYHML